MDGAGALSADLTQLSPRPTNRHAGLAASDGEHLAAFTLGFHLAARVGVDRTSSSGKCSHLTIGM